MLSAEMKSYKNEIELTANLRLNSDAFVVTSGGSFTSEIDAPSNHDHLHVGNLISE